MNDPVRMARELDNLKEENYQIGKAGHAMDIYSF